MVGLFEMVKTAKYYNCPKCGKESRLRRNRVVKNLSYPNGAIPVRRKEEIENVQDAWAYASEVCLHMSKRVLEYPPSEQSDSKLADQMYEDFLRVAPHTDEEIAEFETIHREVIEARISMQQNKQQENSQKTRQLPDYDVIPVTVKDEPRRIPVATDAGRITRLSLALLYGSIVCSVMSNILRGMPLTDSLKVFAQAIYTHYSLLYSDKRMRKDWIGWIEIMNDAENGYGWSAWKHRVKVPDEKGGFETKITTKHMKRMKSKVLRKSQDALNYVEMFEELFSKYGRFVKSNIIQTTGFRKYFDNLQFKPYQRDVIYEYDDYIHNDRSSKPNKHTISRQVMMAEEEEQE